MSKPPPLTIATSVIDDFAGVYYTFKSICLYHPEVCDQIELLLIDQSPDSKHGKECARLVIKNLRKRVAATKYVAMREPRGIGPARNAMFEHARGKYVLAIDSHIQLWPGAIRNLLEYYSGDPDCPDLLTGPLLSDDGHRFIGTHQELVWRKEALGTWAVDERGTDPQGEPFEIPSMGLGCFSCRRDSYPGFHPYQRGFGCGEALFCEQFRSRGDRVLCCPWLRWEHQFPQPNGKTYPVLRVDKITNYLLEYSRLGLEPCDMIDHFDGKLNDIEMAELERRLGAVESKPSVSRCR